MTSNDLPDFGIGYMHGSHIGPDAPAFCRGCGRPMRVYEKRVGWDRSTGTPIIERRAKCSRRWWQLWPLTLFHDSTFGQDRHGDWPCA